MGEEGGEEEVAQEEERGEGTGEGEGRCLEQIFAEVSLNSS